MLLFFLQYILIFLGKLVIFENMAIIVKSIEYFLFNIGGYFDGCNEIRILGDLFETSKSKEDYINILPDPNCELSPILKKELITILNEIYLVKWDRKYYNNEICDGTQWELEIRYNNRKTSKISFGSNEYPKLTKAKGETLVESSESYSKEFKKLLKILNKIADEKNFFQ